MLEILTTDEERKRRNNRLVSCLIAVFLHTLLAVVLSLIVWTTIENQPIELAGSLSSSNREVVINMNPIQTPNVAEEVMNADESNENMFVESFGSDIVMPASFRELNAIPSQPARIEPSAGFFGTHAYGNHFVFVLDISHSMDARDGERFQRAADELLRSIGSLQLGQRYYVYLFSWDLTEMFYDSRSQAYVEAGPGHVEKVRDWIYNISLGSGTDPRRALAMATHMSPKPDAVFLLSDGHFNKPPSPQSETGWISKTGKVTQDSVEKGVEKFYQHIPIHTIAFENPFTKGDMQRIAELTGGEFRYVPTQSHQPVDEEKFQRALRDIERAATSPRQNVSVRLSWARDFLTNGELVFAEYVVRPIRSAPAKQVYNTRLRKQILNILDEELRDVRLEDFEELLPKP